jgi:hypothetical protein
MQLIFQTPESLVGTINNFTSSGNSGGFIFGGWTHSPFTN